MGTTFGGIKMEYFWGSKQNLLRTSHISGTVLGTENYSKEWHYVPLLREFIIKQKCNLGLFSFGWMTHGERARVRENWTWHGVWVLTCRQQRPMKRLFSRSGIGQNFYCKNIISDTVEGKLKEKRVWRNFFLCLKCSCWSGACHPQAPSPQIELARNIFISLFLNVYNHIFKHKWKNMHEPENNEMRHEN